LDIPIEGRYIWKWFTEINESISRISDGVCHLIPPSEYLSWFTLTGNVVYSIEYDILRCMDAEFCKETNKEFQAKRTKREEDQKRELEASRTTRKSRFRK
jgi:hypothetical protein